MLEAGLWEHLQFIDEVGTIEVHHPADATGQGQTWDTLASEPIRANNIVVTQNVHIWFWKIISTFGSYNDSELYNLNGLLPSKLCMLIDVNNS